MKKEDLRCAGADSFIMEGKRKENFKEQVFSVRGLMS